MNNNITNAIFFTVRSIESREVFKNLSPRPSKALIDYFMSLNDGLSNWLNQCVNKPVEKKEDSSISIEPYKSVPENIKTNAEQFENENGPVYSEDQLLVDSLTNATNIDELRAIKGSFLSIYEDLPTQDQNKWTVIHDFILSIPDVEPSYLGTGSMSHSFTIQDYNETFAKTELRADPTHCDKENPLVQDRLGWYCTEDGPSGIAIAAVYPWTGDMTSDHNINWASALISTMINEYPSLKNIILVCHDRDFKGFSGKDEVVNGQLPESIKQKFPQLNLRLIVFQHSNKTVLGALNMKNAIDVFNAIDSYAAGYDTFIRVDNENQNALAHDNFAKKDNNED